MLLHRVGHLHSYFQHNLYFDPASIKMFRSSPGVEQLSAELQKKNRQIDMLDSTINKLNTETEAFKKQIADLRKVDRCSHVLFRQRR